MRHSVLAAMAMAGTMVLPSDEAAADQSCKLQMATSLPLGTDESGGVYVPVEFAGRSLNLLVDTAGYFSMLKPSAVSELGLERRTLPLEDRNVIMLYGGAHLNDYVVANDVKIGAMPLKEKQFLVVPEMAIPAELSGTLAPDIMRFFDIDFDFAGGKMNIFLQDHCEGQVVYWTTGTRAVLPMRVTEDWHISVPVELDGHTTMAELDTGSTRSELSWETAQSQFDLDEKSPGVSLLAHTNVTEYHYPFKALTIGGEDKNQSLTVENPDILLVPDKESRIGPIGARLILGMGILRQLHLYIAYNEHKLYVTPASER